MTPGVGIDTSCMHLAFIANYTAIGYPETESKDQSPDQNYAYRSCQEVQKWKVLLVMTFGNYTLIGFVSTQNLRGNVLNPSNRHIGAREAKSLCLYTLLVPAVKESLMIEATHNGFQDSKRASSLPKFRITKSKIICKDAIGALGAELIVLQ
ncbi:hypothetical protein VNO77_19387 [Canavalia gladiata]|uniref:Uncharacterized protein n=1 Tax=Canavalia gladiata TaxID=3824 RepID=A0AAN9LN95_CANGL